MHCYLLRASYVSQNGKLACLLIYSIKESLESEFMKHTLNLCVQEMKMKILIFPKVTNKTYKNT